MRALFLADAHLHHPDDANYRLLIRFLEEQRGRADLLCILGDLFDFRIGLPALDFPEQEPLLAALAALSGSGTRLIYLEGNHDLHLGSAFAANIGAELHTGPVVMELDGKQVYLCHGDLANPADWRYRLLHLVLRNRLTPLIGRLIPGAFVRGIRKSLQKASRKRYSHDKARWDYGAIIRSFAAHVREQGCDALVLGHFHYPIFEKSADFTLLSLGDWIDRFSYGLYEQGEFSLSCFPAVPCFSVPEPQPAVPEPVPVDP